MKTPVNGDASHCGGITKKLLQNSCKIHRYFKSNQLDTTSAPEKREVNKEILEIVACDVTSLGPEKAATVKKDLVQRHRIGKKRPKANLDVNDAGKLISERPEAIG
jgi:hypothetical protein